MSESLIRFDEKVAIVTGAGRGLGREHALFLASRGAKVVVNDSSAEHALATANDIVRAGGIAVADTNSVADPEAAQNIVQSALKEFGSLHIVLNNAGRGGPTGTLEQTTDHQVATIISTHLVGSYNMSRAAWSHFRQQQFGRILLTSSSAAVGSSARTMEGDAAIARATATRCCSPPDRLLGKFCSRCPRPTSRNTSSARAAAG